MIENLTNPDLDELQSEADDSLGPCGCYDYHMADCPLMTGDETGIPGLDAYDIEYDR